MAIAASPIAIFISHSSRDAELAKALAELFRSALNLSAPQIRCTSVSGYKLDVGADTNEQLRRETVEATLLLGLVTEVSVESAYVLFELGARWGAKKPLAPLLGAGAGPGILAGPLMGLNALLCTREDLLQLVANFAKMLGTVPETPEVYFGQIDRVVAVSEELAAQRGREPSPESADTSITRSLSDLACDYLMEISLPRNDGQVISIDDWKGREAAQYQDALETFQNYGLMTYGDNVYRLTTNGWRLADQLWHLKTLDALTDASQTDRQLAERVGLTDGDAETKELRRHLDEMESLGLITLSKTRGPWHVRISTSGETHRKHRPLTLSGTP